MIAINTVAIGDKSCIKVNQSEAMRYLGVLYEESLDGDTIEKSVGAIATADLLIVAGTSLTVYPAAGLINYYRGNRLVLINRDATPYDDRADLVIHDTLGNVFSKL